MLLVNLRCFSRNLKNNIDTYIPYQGEISCYSIDAELYCTLTFHYSLYQLQPEIQYVQCVLCIYLEGDEGGSFVPVSNTQDIHGHRVASTGQAKVLQQGQTIIFNKNVRNFCLKKTTLKKKINFRDESLQLYRK